MVSSYLLRSQWDVVFRRCIVFMRRGEKPALRALGPKLRKRWEGSGENAAAMRAAVPAPLSSLDLTAGK